MALQTINLGTVANDGTGDPLRTAGQKINDNFVDVISRSDSYTPTGTTQTIDLAEGNLHIITTSSATGNITLTLNNPVVGSSWLFKVIHGATARDLIFPAGTLQSGGLGTTVTASGANQTDIISVVYDGTNYLVALSQNYA